MKKNGYCQFAAAWVSAFIIFSGLAFAQARPFIKVTKLQDHFYRLTSSVSYEANFLAYVCQEGVLLVDAGQKETGMTIKEVLKKIAPENPTVKYLITTHAHMDHSGGNLALAGGPAIIGSEHLKATLQGYTYVLQEFPDDALPTIPVKDSLTLSFGDETIKITAIPGSHDKTDLIVHFAKSGIVCLGDISYGMSFPTIDGFTGNILMYPPVLDMVLAIIPDNATIVSGHGRESSVAELRQFQEMIVKTGNIVKDALAQGKDIATMQKEDILKDWAQYEGMVKRNNWIDTLANAGPSKLRGSLLEALYRELMKSGADAAVEHFYALKQAYPKEYAFDDESQPIRLANWLLEKGQTAQAIKLYEFSLKEFPDSWYVFDNLYKAYMKPMEPKLTLAKYHKLLQFDPGNKGVKWSRENLAALKKPFKLTKAVGQSYAAVYGMRTVTMENGELYYQRAGQSKIKMIAMAEDLFIFKEIFFIRIRVVKENGKVTAIEGLYFDGRVERSDKNS